MNKTTANRCQTQSLVFGKLFVLFYYFRFVLMEKTRSPSPRLRLAAKRYKLVAENFFCEKFSAHWSLLIGINN